MGGEPSPALPNLRIGVSNAAVKTLQEKLNTRNSQLPLKVDGIFGPVTQGAVREFQRQHGLYDNGEVDPVIWAALEQSVSRLPQALRLSFEYRGAAVRFVSAQTAPTMPPPSDDIGDDTDQSGFWYDIRDAQGQTLYRKVLHNPVKFDAEVPSDNPRSRLVRQPLANPQGSFDLLIPLIAGAHTLALISSTPDPKAPPGPAREIARVDLVPLVQHNA